MANKRISSLDDITVVGGTSTPEVNANDILPITDVDDTTGSPEGTTKAVKVSDLMGEAPVQSVAGRTGAVTISNTDVSGLGTAATTDSSDYATAAQGTLADSALQSVSAGDLTDGNFDGEAILGFKASLPTEITTATYTVQDSDNGQVIRVNHATGCTVTIPSGLFTTDSTGFNCSFIQVGNGQITFDNDGTSVINNRQSHTKTNAQWAAASVVSTANNVFVLAGDTAS